MSRAAQNMSLSPVVLRATTAYDDNCSTPPPPTVVLPAPHMVRCAVAVAHEQLPPARKDDSGDHEAGVGLVLNFSNAHVVPSARHLATIFLRFGPVKEVWADNSTALVVFDSGAHADEAFSGATEIGSISVSLVSFRVSSSLPAAPGDLLHNLRLKACRRMPRLLKRLGSSFGRLYMRMQLHHHLFMYSLAPSCSNPLGFLCFGVQPYCLGSYDPP
jgi:hypothetical protein